MGRGWTLALAILLLAGLHGQAAAQEPADTTAAEAEALPGDTAAVDTMAADTLPPPRPPYRPPRAAFSVTTGYLAWTDLQTQGILAVRPEDEEGTALRRTLGSEGGLQVGASALLGLTPAWALRAGLGWGSGRITASVSGEDEELVDAVRALSVPGEAEFRLLTAEAAVRFRFRSARLLQPYVELGASALRWDLDGEAYPGAADLEDGDIQWAGLAALGGIIPVWRRIAARVQVSGTFFRSPLSTAEPGEFAAGDSLTVSFADPQTGPFADRAIELSRTIRLDVGLTVELGRVRSPSSPAPAEDAPPAGSPR